MTQTRSFTIDPNILYSVIQSQAGTLEKALLEGVQNSYDAGSTFCDIEINPTSFTIFDDGKGFKNDEEIELFFERFGTPHTEGDGAKFGKFRMGRGQIFSFGANRWETGSYRMNVDIKNKGLDYQLSKDNKEIKGCHIYVDLYNQLSNLNVQTIERNMAQMVKYLDIPVSINGKVVSKSAADSKWDLETDDAYIRLKETGGVDVWHEGIYIRNYAAWNMGISAEVVGKNQFQVNFARNDIMVSQCDRWKRVSNELKKLGGVKREKKAALNDDERQMLINDFLGGEISIDDIKKEKLILDTNDKAWEVQKLFKIISASKGLNALSLEDKPFSRLADKIHKLEAFVLSKKCLQMWHVESVLELVEKFDGYSRWDKWSERAKIIPIEDLISLFDEDHYSITDKELNKHSLLMLKTIRNTFNSTAIWNVNAPYSEHKPVRSYYAGVSDSAEAWTDGRSTIWINKKLLSRASKSFEAYMELCSVVIHEYCHNRSDKLSHSHDLEFYEKFHDISLNPTYITHALRGFNAFINASRKEGLRIYAHAGRADDVYCNYSQKITEDNRVDN